MRLALYVAVLGVLVCTDVASAEAGRLPQRPSPSPSPGAISPPERWVDALVQRTRTEFDFENDFQIISTYEVRAFVCHGEEVQEEASENLLFTVFATGGDEGEKTEPPFGRFQSTGDVLILGPVSERGRLFVTVVTSSQPEVVRQALVGQAGPVVGAWGREPGGDTPPNTPCKLGFS